MRSINQEWRLLSVDDWFGIYEAMWEKLNTTKAAKSSVVLL
jgi:hypothetical protein